MAGCARGDRNRRLRASRCLPLDSHRGGVGVIDKDGGPVAGGGTDGAIIAGTPALLAKEVIPARFVVVADIPTHQRHLDRAIGGDACAGTHSAIDVIGAPLVHHGKAIISAIAIKIDQDGRVITRRHHTDRGVFKEAIIVQVFTNRGVKSSAPAIGVVYFDRVGV